MSLRIPAVVNIFRTPPKLSQFKQFSTRQQFRGYNHINCIHSRSYAKLPPDLKKRTSSLNRGPVTWGSLAVFLLFGGGCFVYFREVKRKKEEAKEKATKQSVGMAAIGGPFDLIDTNGNEVTHETFYGKWILMYFGFCHCPDICPDVLDKLTSVVEEVNANSGSPNLQPVFITVDPVRDTKEQIKEYLLDFHPDFIGLTGTDEQVHRICKAYRIYFSKGPADDDNDYIVDHTVISYLVDPRGNFTEYYGQNKNAAEMVNSILVNMALKQ